MSTPPPVHRADPPRPLADARWLAGVFILAVVLRVALHLHTRDAAYWSGDYSNYYVVAQNLLHGRGLVLEYLGPKRAFWPPVYPLFLVLGSAGGSGHWPVLLLQAAAGGGTVLCAYALCWEWFDGRAARLASLGTALYPYYVSHDGSLQETGLFTFLTALSVLLLVRSWRGAAPRTATAAGAALGLAVLTRSTLAPFALLALAWLLPFGAGDRRAGWRAWACATLACGLVVGCWLARNAAVVGAPVLTSQAGRMLWTANNAVTFRHYPRESIDASQAEALHRLTPAQAAALRSLQADELGQQRWFERQAEEYIRRHPVETARGMAVKVAAGFSPVMSPRKQGAVQWLYLASYGPALLLGTAGMWRSRRHWREHLLIYLLFAAFAAVSALFWAHTSHRTYLDVYLILFAAPLITQVPRPRLESLNSHAGPGTGPASGKRASAGRQASTPLSGQPRSHCGAFSLISGGGLSTQRIRTLPGEMISTCARADFTPRT